MLLSQLVNWYTYTHALNFIQIPKTQYPACLPDCLTIITRPQHPTNQPTNPQQGEEKRRRTALREARIAFLEEEVPALVARRVDMEVIK